MTHGEGTPSQGPRVSNATQSDRTPWHDKLRRASSANEVLHLVRNAMPLFGAKGCEALPEGSWPKSINSRADVEHWAHRLCDPALGGEHRALDSLRSLFAAAIVRLNEIGPRRRGP